MAPFRDPAPLRGPPGPVAPSPDGSGASSGVLGLGPPSFGCGLCGLWPVALPLSGLRSRPGPLRPEAALALARVPSLPLGRSGPLGRWRAACARHSPPRPPPAGLAAAWPGPVSAGLASASSRAPSRRVFGSPLACAGLPVRSPSAALRAPLCPLPCRAGSPWPRAPFGGAARSSRPAGLRPLRGRFFAPPRRARGYQTVRQRSRVRPSGLWPPLTAFSGLIRGQEGRVAAPCHSAACHFREVTKMVDTQEHLCYYEGAGASRSPPATGLLPVTLTAKVEGGRFFRLPLPSPSIRRGRRRGMGTFHVTRVRHGRGRRQRGKAKQGRGQKSAPLLPFSNPPALQLNKTALYFVELS